MTRHRAPRRRRHPVAWIALGTAVLLMLDLGAWAAYIVAHAVFTLAPAVLLGLAVWRAWRRRRGVTPPRPPRVVRGAIVPPAGQLAEVTAERDGLRRSVTKLEQDAAAHDELLERLERVTRRPVELHIADLERAHRLYGPAAFGKTGRRP
jgi:hypothetical protein